MLYKFTLSMDEDYDIDQSVDLLSLLLQDEELSEQYLDPDYSLEEEIENLIGLDYPKTPELIDYLITCEEYDSPSCSTNSGSQYNNVWLMSSINTASTITFMLMTPKYI